MLTDFDELYVVSDLHLGGDRGFQIFHQRDTLASLVRNVKERAGSARRIGLVLNGDIVDFLAEDPPRYLDPWHAEYKLRRVMDDPAFSLVFDALGEYVQTENCYLVLVLGNHDLELALPPVRSTLAEHLAKGSIDAQARIYAVVDGTGYRCRVGGANALCLHGNEIDPFNVVDHTELLKCARAMNRQMQPDDWKPNAGTRLVIDIMNDLKRKYRWIDLLKPPVGDVTSILLARDPKAVAAKLARAMPVLARALRDARRLDELLESDDVEGDATPIDPVLATLPGELDTDGAPSAEDADAQALLASVELAMKDGKDGLDLLSEELAGDSELLAGVDTVRREGTRGVLRVLRRFYRRSGETAPDSTFDEIDRRVGPEVDFVITGHTHVRKSLRRRYGSGYYYNCGTWISVLSPGDDLLKDREAFEQLWEAMDAYKGLEPLRALDALKKLPSVVRIVSDDAGVEGSLCSVEDAAPGLVKLSPVGDGPHRVPRGATT